MISATSATHLDMQNAAPTRVDTVTPSNVDANISVTAGAVPATLKSVVRSALANETVSTVTSNATLSNLLATKFVHYPELKAIATDPDLLARTVAAMHPDTSPLLGVCVTTHGKARDVLLQESTLQHADGILSAFIAASGNQANPYHPPLSSLLKVLAAPTSTQITKDLCGYLLMTSSYLPTPEEAKLLAQVCPGLTRGTEISARYRLPAY